MKGASKKKVQLSIVLLFLAIVVIWLPFAANSQDAKPLSPPSTAASWQPNQAAGDTKFLGTDACAECHRAKVASQKKTHMGRALATAAESDILRANPKLTYRQGPYAYEILREGDTSTYKVMDGTNTIAIPLLYCFGSGEAGQTYVLQYKDRFYESRVSFYDSLRALDITMGHQPGVPKNLIEAMGREMSMEETRNCFGCHTTNGVNGRTLQLDHLMKGVTCEACHGPGEKHVSAMKAEEFKHNQIFNPKRLSAEELSNFCGTCHRSWEQVALMGLRGVNNVRFQPYRLTNSKCYDSDDKRISCTACHDPHEERKRDTAYYDAKCTTCHNATARAAALKAASSNKRVPAICKVGKAKCSTCHMPKLEIPGSHFKFADHQIRIVRPGDEYPN
jgi:hypothetical protein